MIFDALKLFLIHIYFNFIALSEPGFFDCISLCQVFSTSFNPKRTPKVTEATNYYELPYPNALIPLVICTR